jgi:hypothetical protein
MLTPRSAAGAGRGICFCGKIYLKFYVITGCVHDLGNKPAAKVQKFFPPANFFRNFFAFFPHYFSSRWGSEGCGGKIFLFF